MRKSCVAVLAMVVAFATSGCVGKKKDVSGYLSRAEELKAAGDLKAAKAELRSALAVKPADPAVNLALAKI